MNNIVIGMGEALWDIFPNGKKVGGAPANFAYNAAQFGGDSRVVSAVGNDKLGDELIANFTEKKIGNTYCKNTLLHRRRSCRIIPRQNTALYYQGKFGLGQHPFYS